MGFAAQQGIEASVDIELEASGVKQNSLCSSDGLCIFLVPDLIPVKIKFLGSKLVPICSWPPFVLLLLLLDPEQDPASRQLW